MATKNSLDVSALSCFAFCFGTRSKFQMKALAFLILIVASVARAEDFRTIDGKEYKNVTVSRVEPDGIVLRTKSGISKVYFVELPKEVQDRFRFNAANAAGHSAKPAANQAASQHPQTQLPSLPPVQETKDKITEEIWQFRLKARALYNASKFDELEALAAQLRTERGRFGNGSWKIVQFYESLGCRSDEPESMWQLPRAYSRKLGRGQAAFHHSTGSSRRLPYRIRVARSRKRLRQHGDKRGWRLFSERLAKAKELLDKSADFEPKCPMWWRVRMTVARGQGWSWDDCENVRARVLGL